MTIYRIGRPEDAKAQFKKLGCDAGGIAIMAQKCEIAVFAIKDLKTPGANILKQDALSVGADLAVPAGVICCETEQVDALLMGTPRQLSQLAKKAKAQPFGLRRLGEALEAAFGAKDFPLRIMGVINANDDSFFAGSRRKGGEALEAAERMIEDGAQMIDIGAVSTRPGSDPVSAEEELRRLGPLLDALYQEKVTERACFSIDTTAPEVMRYALDRGFGFINDISGMADPRTAVLASEYGVQLCIMHMQNDPKTMQSEPRYDNVIADIEQFFSERLATAEAAGLRREQIVLDVGIGFGKRLEHNLALLKHHRHFMKFGCELLVGASRKSMIHAIIPSEIEARLPGTLAIHLHAIRNGANIVRCHDVAEHRQAITVQEAIGKGDIW